jgi:hypothetical protein
MKDLYPTGTRLNVGCVIGYAGRTISWFYSESSRKSRGSVLKYEVTSFKIIFHFLPVIPVSHVANLQLTSAVQTSPLNILTTDLSLVSTAETRLIRIWEVSSSSFGYYD